MRPIILALIYLTTVSNLSAQKRPVTIDDFKDWNSHSNIKLHPKGTFISYEIKPGKGDKTLVINWLNTHKTDTFFRGESLQYNQNGSLLAFKVIPTMALKRSEKKKETPKSKQAKDSLFIYLPLKDTIIKYPELISYSVPEEGGDWIAFTTDEKFKMPTDTSEQDSIKLKRPKPKKGGKNLVIFNGVTQDTNIVRNVSAFKWSLNGNTLVIAKEIKDSLKQGEVLYFNTKSNEFKELYSSTGEINKIAIDEEGKKAAWLCSDDTLKEKTYELRMAILNESTNILVADTNSTAMPKGWAPSKNSSVYFSESGERLYFGSAKRPEQAPKDTLLKGEKVDVDVWSWHDTYLQPWQKKNLVKEKNRTYPAVYHIEDKKLVQLTTEKLDISIKVKQDMTYSIASNGDAYARESNWTARFLRDYYLVNNTSGEERLLVKGISRGYFSPDEKYFAYYEFRDSNYYVIDLKTFTKKILSKGIPTLLVDEENDRPNDPGNYGLAAWSENDEYAFIYDKYDTWAVDPKGKKAPRNLTKGRSSETRFRLIRLDREKPYIDTKKPVLLSVFENKTKNRGFASIDFKKANSPQILIKDAKYFGYPIKAKHKDLIYYSQQDCNEYPDLWLSNTQFELPKKITDINPQKEELLWSKVKMVNWTSFNGDSLSGLLYTPENFSPDSVYPMLIYYYERNSDNLHRFNSIYPSYSTINKTLYPSNGYVLFIPDIVYRIGYPGQSAYECVVSGVQSLLTQYDWINPYKIGLQGQSWGGYQTAYLITQTNMFAAAMAGAPVSNMTSAYGGIRWGSGMSRMFQYEHTQSRIGGTLWDKPLLYVENSPLFYANKVNTPLLMMHNDNDGAVPWYQGIEYFVALRRLDKPVWMLNYNNEPHNLNPSSWGDRTDLSIRMKQFFDHYLKDMEAPDWMTNGVEAAEKETMKGY